MACFLLCSAMHISPSLSLPTKHSVSQQAPHWLLQVQFPPVPLTGSRQSLPQQKPASGCWPGWEFAKTPTGKACHAVFRAEWISGNTFSSQCWTLHLNYSQHSVLAFSKWHFYLFEIMSFFWFGVYFSIFLEVKAIIFSNSVFPFSISNDHKRHVLLLNWKTAYVQNTPGVIESKSLRLEGHQHHLVQLSTHACDHSRPRPSVPHLPLSWTSPWTVAAPLPWAAVSLHHRSFR